MREIGIQRESGLDLIKILACCAVVGAHTLIPTKALFNRIITLIGTISIPSFFTIAGYFMLKRDTLDYRYALTKISRILFICFMWEFLHAIAHFLYYRETRDFLSSFLLDFFQQGLFFHFWYMGALILVYTIAPLIHKLHRHSNRLYDILLISLIALCAGLDLLYIIIQKQFVLDIPQNLRLWTWILYVMIGGYIAANGKLADCFDQLGRYSKLILVIALLVWSCIWQYFIGMGVFGHVVREAFHGSLPVVMLSTSAFLFCRQLSFSAMTSRIITYLSSLTMGIYIMHPFILAIFKKYIPAFVDGNALWNICFWLITILTSGACTAIVKKTPIINKLLTL